MCDYLGPDRQLFSVDYPYETIEMGCGWRDGDAEDIKKALGRTDTYRRISRENAKKLLKMGDFRDMDAGGSLGGAQCI